METTKAKVMLLAETERSSNDDGSAREYLSSADLNAALGLANSLYAEVIVTAMSQDARAVFSLWTSTYDDKPPRFVGKRVPLTVDGTNFSNEITITGPGIVAFWTGGPIRANAELVVRIFDSDVTPQRVTVEAGAWATLHL